MSMIKEILIPLKNEPGRLSVISDLMLLNGIKIIAFQVSDGDGTGRLRMVVNDPERALNVLRTEEYQAEENQAIACEIPGHPGGLNAVLKPLKTADINVDTIYPVMGPGSALIMGIDQIEKGLKLLKEHWIRILGDDVYNM
jgi:hypothetical protein